MLVLGYIPIEACYAPKGAFLLESHTMSTHLRHWGIALVAISLFAIPTLATQAEGSPQNTASTAIQAAAGPQAPILKILQLKVTAYASEVDETDSTPFITADGSHVHDGVVATNLLPFGTKVMIPSLFGDKVFTVHDRMNVKFSHNIDIWMATRQDAIDFGVRTADIVVLGEASDTNLSINK